MKGNQVHKIQSQTGDQLIQQSFLVRSLLNKNFKKQIKTGHMSSKPKKWDISATLRKA